MIESFVSEATGHRCSTTDPVRDDRRQSNDLNQGQAASYHSYHAFDEQRMHSAPRLSLSSHGNFAKYQYSHQECDAKN